MCRHYTICLREIYQHETVRGKADTGEIIFLLTAEHRSLRYVPQSQIVNFDQVMKDIVIRKMRGGNLWVLWGSDWIAGPVGSGMTAFR